MNIEKYKSKKFVCVLLCFPMCYLEKIPPSIFLTILLTYLTLDVADKKIKGLNINIKEQDK